MIPYIIAYVIGIIVFFILSPIPFKRWGWQVTGNYNNNPPPHIISLVWPFVLGGYAIYFLAVAVLFILSYPFSLVERIHLWIAQYISDESVRKRKEQKAEKKLKKVTPLVAPKDSLAIAAEEWEERQLAYREANCKNCGQTLAKI